MKFKYMITGLDCPNCAGKLAKNIGDNDGIISAKINFLTEKLTVESELCEDAVFDIVKTCARAFDKSLKVEK